MHLSSLGKQRLANLWQLLLDTNVDLDMPSLSSDRRCGVLVAGNDVDKIAEGWTTARHADALALTNLEASMYTLIGSGPMRFLNPGFLRIAAHLALGECYVLKSFRIVHLSVRKQSANTLI